jgi:hypothetical protein
MSPAAWVLDGEGIATRKFDRTCTKLDENGAWWARREVKPGKSAPANFVPEEADEVTGKTVGWEPIEQSPFVKAWREVMARYNSVAEYATPIQPGTYELCGPKVNGNPEGLTSHSLIRHGAVVYANAPTDFDGIRELLSRIPDAEGIVWHHPDGRMAKIKRRDFPR